MDRCGFSVWLDSAGEVERVEDFGPPFEVRLTREVLEPLVDLIFDNMRRQKEVACLAVSA